MTHTPEEATPASHHSSKLKQRIVGAIVLVALAVIFIPMLLSTPEDEQLLVPVIVDTPAMPSIPPEPEFRIEDVAIPEPVPEPVVDVVEVETESAAVPAHDLPAPVPRAVSQAAPSQAIAEPTEPQQQAKPGIDNSNLPKSWSVQVSSTSSQTGANALRDEFRNKGYKAYVRPEGATFKVLVGPFIRQSDAINECKKIKQRKKNQAACFVVRYQP